MSTPTGLSVYTLNKKMDEYVKLSVSAPSEQSENKFIWYQDIGGNNADLSSNFSS